jgi:hypothetical protein
MKTQLGAFRDKYLAALIGLLLLAGTTYGQSYQSINAYGYKWQRGIFQYNLGVPNDTLAVPVTQLLVPHIATKDSVLYVWSVAAQRWVAVGTGVASGSSNYIQNQYISKQTANAWFDTAKVARLNVLGRLYVENTEPSFYYTPFRATSTATNAGILFSNLPAWDSRLSSTLYSNQSPPLNGSTRNQSGAAVNFYRFLYQNEWDTMRIDYSHHLQQYYRYNFDTVVKVFDTARTVNKQFWAMAPGYASYHQYYTNGAHVRFRTEQFGNNSANFTANHGFFNAGGGTIRMEGSFPLVHYFADLDLQRDLTANKKVFKSMTAGVGISQFLASWKFNQGGVGLVQNAGNYVSSITMFDAWGQSEEFTASALSTWATTKAAILASYTVDSVFGYRIRRLYSPTNEVKNGFAIYQDGIYDLNVFKGRTYNVGNTTGPVQTAMDTTSALVITKGRTWSDTLSTQQITASQYVSPVQTLTDGATITWNMSSGSNATVTLGGNRTLFITGITAGTYGTLKVVQDATGSRTITLPAGSKVIGGGAGAVTLTTTASAIDILTFFYDGINYFWNIGKNYN